MTLLRNILAALALAGFGGYILRTHPGNLALVVGALSVLGSLGIAFPTQMNDAGTRVKSLLVLLIPVVRGALPGGSRVDDPPAPKDGAP